MVDFDPASAGNGHFLKVPVWLLRVPDLTAADVLTMAAIIDYARTHSECAPPVRALSSVLGKDASNVQRSIAHLRAAGVLRAVERSGRPSMYEFLPHPAATPGELAAPRDRELAVGQSDSTPRELAVGTPGELAVGGTANSQQEGPRTRGAILRSEERREIRKRNGRTRPSRVDQALSDPRVQQVAAHYRARFLPHSSWQLAGKHNGKTRAIAVLDALEAGRSVEDLIRSIDGMEGSDFHRQNGHTDLELAMRLDKIDSFIARSRNGKAKRGPAPVSTNYGADPDWTEEAAQ